MASIYAGRFQGDMRDLGGNALRGAEISVCEVGTATPATLYNNAVLITSAGPGDSLGNAYVPPAVAQGMPGVDAAGVITFYADASKQYDLRGTHGGRVLGPFRVSVEIDLREPPTPGSVSEAMLAFTVATQAEIDAESTARGVAVAAEATARATADAALTTALAGKEPTIPPGTYPEMAAFGREVAARIATSPHPFAGHEVSRVTDGPRHRGFGHIAVDPDDPDHIFIVYRDAGNHGYATDSSIMAITTTDGGATWGAPVTIIATDTPRMHWGAAGWMGAGRWGWYCQRSQNSSVTPEPSVFIFTDDMGETWNTDVLTEMPEIYLWFRLYPYPASVGGHDTLGFIGYGDYMGTAGDPVIGSTVWVATVDNGVTWTWGVIFNPPNNNPGEYNILRVGTQDKWILYWRDDAQGNTSILNAGCALTTDMKTFGAKLDSGQLLGQHPQIIVQEPGSDLVWWYASNRDMAGNLPQPDYPAQWQLVCQASAAELWDNNGQGWTPWELWRRFPANLLGYMMTDYVDGQHFGMIVANEELSDVDGEGEWIDGTGQSYASIYFLRPPRTVAPVEERVFIPASEFSPVTDGVWAKLDAATSSRPYLHFAHAEGKAVAYLARGDGGVPIGWTNARVEVVFTSPSLGNCRWRVTLADEPALWTDSWTGTILNANVVVAAVDTPQTSPVPALAAAPNGFAISRSAKLYLQIWHQAANGNTVPSPVAFLGVRLVRL